MVGAGQRVLALVPVPDGFGRAVVVADDPEVEPALAPTVAGVPANGLSAAVSSDVLPLPC